MHRIPPFHPTLLTVCAGLLLAVPLAAAADTPAAALPAYDIPRLEGVTVDGNPADWQDAGFKVDVLAGLTGKRKPETDADATLRLAWDARGLLVLLRVADNEFTEAEKDNALWEKDGVELFAATAPGAKDFVQFIVAPGLDPRHPALRVQPVDRRSPELKQKTRPAPAVTAAAARLPQGGGYWLEALLPWDNLGITPAAGAELAFQACVNDADADSAKSQLAWFPASDTSRDTKKMHRLRLAAAPSPAVTAAATVRIEHFRRIRVEITAAAECAGMTAGATAGDNTVTATLKPAGRFTVASLSLPLPPPGKPAPAPGVRAGGRPVFLPPLEDVAKARDDAFAGAELLFTPFVFTGREFPKPEFANPSLVEDLIGPYELKTTYYDAGFNPVTAAATPGRYGAVVEIIPENGAVTRRFFTLFRQPEKLRWWTAKLQASFDLPPETGISPAVAAEQKLAENSLVRTLIGQACSRDPVSAVFFAGLFETKPGDGDLPARLGPWGKDALWWYTFKKKAGLLEPYAYAIHVPEGQPPAGGKWPLILFLHGSGERGTDLNRVKTHGPFKVLAAGKIDLPFILVAPQCPPQAWWNPHQLLDLLDDVAAKYPVDPDRVCLTGLSMGGFGSWQLACLAPERFAAVAPVCGGGDETDAARLKDLPVWAVHGGKDDVVPPSLSTDMAEALRALQGRVRFTLYPDAGHDSWTAFYDNPEFYRWLLRQRRNAPEQPPATVRGREPDPAP